MKSWPPCSPLFMLNCRTTLLLRANIDSIVYLWCEAAVEFVSLIKDHLEHHDALRRPKSSPALTTHPIHRDRAIVRLTKRLASLKNNSRKQFPSERSQFLNAVRAHNKALRAERQQQREKSGFKQEKAFRNNPWKFAKSVCNEPVKSSPTF